MDGKVWVLVAASVGVEASGVDVEPASEPLEDES